MNVTFFKSITDTKSPTIISVEEALSRIKLGSSKAIITKVYNGDIEAKKELPCICFTGEFTTRSISGLKHHNGLAILDFDNTKKAVNPFEEAKKLKKRLEKDEFIYSCFLSPSLGGVKALVKIPICNDDSEYKQYYESLLVMYPESDGVTKDISRVSFESYDPDLYLNEDSKVWDVKPDEESELNKLLEIPVNMLKGAKDGECHNTLLRASRLAGGYIGGGYLNEEEVVEVLTEIATERKLDKPYLISRTISDGIKYGKQSPLEINSSIQREFKIDKLKPPNEKDILRFIAKKGTGWGVLDDFYDGKVELGLKTNIRFLDKHFVWKKNSKYLLTAAKGRGKTLITTALQVIAHIVGGWSWVISAQENEVEDYKENLFRYLTHKDTEEVRKTNPKKYKEIQEYIDKHFIFLVGVNTIEEALVTTKYIVDRHPDRTFALFLDPVNAFMAGFGYTGQIDYSNGAEIGKKTLDWVRDNCTVFMTQHEIISKQRLQENLSQSVFGEGGWWLNKADFTMGLSREQGTNDNIINIDNVRNKKTGGGETFKSNPLVITWKMYDIDIRLKESPDTDVRYNVIESLQEEFGRRLL